nr:reverse transcriptase domain-containing protein [Tanacetum cinerariifolium]
MVRLLRQNCQFHGFRDEDANEHLNKYLSITQFIKQNGISQDIINLNLFLFSLTHEAESWVYTLKTHSIHTWEEMVSMFLSKYFPYSRTLKLRKEILNFRQLPTELVFEAWEIFKFCLRKCPDHKILLLNQILTFYNEITMIDQERFMVAVGGNFMRKTPQEAYDLIKNMTQHHFQWDAEVYYNTTTDMRPGHPNTFYYLDSDESDDNEPSEMVKDRKSIHHLSGSHTPSSDPIVESLSPLPTPFGDSDSLLEEADTLLSQIDDSFPEYETFYFNIEEKSSGSTTTHSDLSLPEYDSFIFDLSIDPLSPADRSDLYHEEFANKLAHIIPTPENEDKVFDPVIFFINEVFSFTRKTPHLMNDNFLIDKCHSFSGISLMIESSVKMIETEQNQVKMIENGAKPAINKMLRTRNTILGQSLAIIEAVV